MCAIKICPAALQVYTRAKFEVLTEALLKIQVFCEVTQRQRYLRFKGTTLLRNVDIRFPDDWV
jgi:hypothetical protein